VRAAASPLGPLPTTMAEVMMMVLSFSSINHAVTTVRRPAVATPAPVLVG
jgi:hypothetical protein